VVQKVKQLAVQARLHATGRAYFPFDQMMKLLKPVWERAFLPKGNLPAAQFTVNLLNFLVPELQKASEIRLAPTQSPQHSGKIVYTHYSTERQHRGLYSAYWALFGLT
jgi:hypothetical protein